MSNTAQQQVNLNIDELKGFLKHIITNNRFLDEQNKPRVAVGISGESGIGKTSAALQLANELGLSYIKLNLSQIEELGDLVGFPIRQFQLCKSGTKMIGEVKKKTEVQTHFKKVETKRMVPVMVKQTITEQQPVKRQVMGADGKLIMRDVMMAVQVEKEVEEMQEQTFFEDVPYEVTVDVSSITSQEDESECLWVDEHAIQEYIKQGYEFTGEKRMSYCPPEWIANRTGGGILILDDWTRADTRLLQAVMEIIDRQEYISWKLPKDWHILLTENPDNGEYLVQSIDTAQRTRFISVNLKYDGEVWGQWAEKQKIDGRCINFQLLNPDLVSSRVNPRSITTFFNSISSIEDFSKELPLIQMIGEGSVGPEFSTMFTMFINNKLDKLISPKDILLHDNESHILGELRSCIGRDNDYRADIASVLVTRLINYAITYSETNTVYKKTIDRLIKLTTDPETFTDDLKYVLIKKLINGNKIKFQSLMTNPDVLAMSMK